MEPSRHHDDINIQLVRGIPLWQSLFGAFAIVFACGGVYFKQLSMEESQKELKLLMMSAISQLQTTNSNVAVVTVSHDLLKKRVDIHDEKIDDLRKEIWKLQLKNQRGTSMGSRG